MKITQLNKEDPRLWLVFLKFFVDSQPYDLSSFHSPHLKRKKIKDLFDFYMRTCVVYVAEEDSKIAAAVFLGKHPSYFDVEFVFGIRKNFSSSALIALLHDIFNKALETYNKNYIKSEIRRKHKVESFKKWIERYDKRAIIFNDHLNTVVWCKSNRMSAKFKVVGTNKTTDHLMGEEANLGIIRKNPHSLIKELLFKDGIYLLDEKSIDFLPDRVLIHGFLSDNKENVGKVALEFIPQNEK